MRAVIEKLDQGQNFYTQNPIFEPEVNIQKTAWEQPNCV